MILETKLVLFRAHVHSPDRRSRNAYDHLEQALLQRMSAIQRKVRAREHDDLCLLREKACQSVDQATKLFKLHNQIRDVYNTYISNLLQIIKHFFAHLEALLFLFVTLRISIIV